VRRYSVLSHKTPHELDRLICEYRGERRTAMEKLELELLFAEDTVAVAAAVAAVAVGNAAVGNAVVAALENTVAGAGAGEKD
jgi:hypothetical protein